MADPYLSDLLHGKKTEIDDPELTQAISEEIDALLENAPPGNELLTLPLLRKKLEHEIRNDPVALEAKDHISLAISILINDEQLKEELSHLGGPNLEIPSESGQIILKIGIDKYEQGLFDESLAIFHFLTLVNRNEPDYWFRLGLIARQCANYPLALRALNTASLLAPTFVGSHIFAALCHLQMHSKDGALAELASAKGLPIDDVWKDDLEELDDLIRRAS